MKIEIVLACGTVLSSDALAAAGISHLPCGRKQPIVKYKHLWKQRSLISIASLHASGNLRAWDLRGADVSGFQIVTGYPSYRQTQKSDYYLYISDIDVEASLISRYPDTFQQIERLYRDNVQGSPCVVRTKSDGRRFSCFSTYGGPKISFKDADDKMLFEIFCLQGLSRLDDRYAFLEGSLLDVPVLPKSTLAKMHVLLSELPSVSVSSAKTDRRVVGRSELAGLVLEWGENNRSQLLPTEYCPFAHTSNRDEVRFTRYKNGSVDGICFNCGSWWWQVVPPLIRTQPIARPKARPKARLRRVS